ncbi:MAG: hypothetical protein AAGA80_12870 [Cyanobacteria bacterium P01_F01_bin.143]
MMGRWCEIKCNCSNREPLLEGDWAFYSTYRKKYKFRSTDKLKQVAEEWRKNLQGMYKCGHRDGTLIQLWPGDLFIIGKALDFAYKDQPESFEIFRKIYNWRNYEDEYLALTEDDVVLWELEIEQLQNYLSGEIYMGFYEQKKFNYYLRRNPLLYGNVPSTLKDGLKLCEISLISDNLVEFFW